MNATCQSSHTPQRLVYRPAVKILESPEAVELIAEIPGADEQSTEVSVEQDTLTVRARVIPTEANGARLVYADHRDGDYERQFQLSSDIDRNQIEAQVKHGVLRVRLPKADHAQTKKVNVLAG